MSFFLHYLISLICVSQYPLPGSQICAMNIETSIKFKKLKSKTLRKCFYSVQVITISCIHFKYWVLKKIVSAWQDSPFGFPCFVLQTILFKQLSVMSDGSSLHINWVVLSCLKKDNKNKGIQFSSFEMDGLEFFFFFLRRQGRKLPVK